MKKEFIVNRQGKDFVLYAGLLDQAHHEGLKRITTALIQAPSGENGQMAICRAEVETDRGVFTGIGDASPENVGRMIAMHTIRMAETRAKARALRDASIHREEGVASGQVAAGGLGLTSATVRAGTEGGSARSGRRRAPWW